jgi:hypothetical protein
MPITCCLQCVALTQDDCSKWGTGNEAHVCKKLAHSEEEDHDDDHGKHDHEHKRRLREDDHDHEDVMVSGKSACVQNIFISTQLPEIIVIRSHIFLKRSRPLCDLFPCVKVTSRTHSTVHATGYIHVGFHHSPPKEADMEKLEAWINREFMQRADVGVMHKTVHLELKAFE